VAPYGRTPQYRVILSGFGEKRGKSIKKMNFNVFFGEK
jgi:hypothetical protein